VPNAFPERERPKLNEKKSSSSFVVSGTSPQRQPQPQRESLTLIDRKLDRLVFFFLGDFIFPQIGEILVFFSSFLLAKFRKQIRQILSEVPASNPKTYKDARKCFLKFTLLFSYRHIWLNHLRWMIPI
jgi:hypothetical protein